MSLIENLLYMVGEEADNHCDVAVSQPISAGLPLVCPPQALSCWTTAWQHQTQFGRGATSQGRRDLGLVLELSLIHI